MKKLFALLLALTMIFSLATTAFAADITISGSPENHTYTAYQILDGNISDDKLVDVEWGTGVNSATLLVALQAATFDMDSDSNTAAEAIFAQCTTAAGVAEILGERVTSDTQVMDQIADIIAKHTTTASGTFDADAMKITGLEDGYYLIKAADATSDDNDAVSDFLVELTDSELVITYKGQPTTSEKKVKDTNDSITVVSTDWTTGTQDWQDSADYDIGDYVPFLLVANLPDAATYNDYETYKLTFHDKLDAGFTFAPTTVKVFVGTVNTDGSYNYDNTKPVAEANYKVTTNCKDGCSLGVEIANTKTIAAAGQSIFVTFEARLNAQAVHGKMGNLNKSWVTYSNNPNGEGEGKTPEDTVVVFTYQVDVNKYYVDNENNQKPLAGATFTLYKFILDAAGSDTLRVSDTNTLTGNWVAQDVVKTVEGDEFNFPGLDDGYYKLEETEAPEGYNKVDDMYFTIDATHELTFATFDPDKILTNLAGGKVDDGTLNTITFTPKLDDGSLSSGVENKSGTTLPETGGMGTTLFYVIGGIMVAAAAILLVTKKRMSVEG